MKINKTGFTVVELIIVSLIIAGLSYFSITKYNTEIKNSRLLEATGIMQFAMANTDLYLIKNGTPKSPVQFTGRNRNFNGVALPGNCSANDSVCETEFWIYESNCQPNLCTITVQNKGWLPGGNIVITLDASKKGNSYQITKVGDGSSAVLNYLCPFLKVKKMYPNSPLALQACEK